jgi:hypothetical protein
MACPTTHSYHTMLCSCTVCVGAPTRQLLAVRGLWPQCQGPFVVGTKALHCSPTFLLDRHNAATFVICTSSLQRTTVKSLPVPPTFHIITPPDVPLSSSMHLENLINIPDEKWQFLEIAHHDAWRGQAGRCLPAHGLAIAH